MNYNSLAIEITRKCSLNCAHCCYSGGINTKADIDIEKFSSFVSGLTDDKNIMAISLTGGEPFYCFNLLKACVEVAHNNKFQVGVVTSGVWASSYKHAIERIQELKNCGLNMITVSLDEYHLKYVKKDCILNLAKAARICKVEISIQVAVLNNSELGCIFNGLQQILPYIHVEFIKTYPVGNAVNINKEYFITDVSVSNAFCEKGSSYFVSSEFELFPCCSPLAHTCCFNLGIVSEKKGLEIRNLLERNKTLAVIRHFGFAPYQDVLEEAFSKGTRVVSACELCSYLFSEKNYIKTLIQTNLFIENYVCNEHLDLYSRIL
ncbi:MAG: radical SAM protein [Agathobacter sp.]|nr:radical SAM protein [Agathobacter sp.]